MAYVTIAECIEYGGFDSDFSSDASDFDKDQSYTLLENLIPRAQAIIDEYTGRTFEASSDIRYFDASEDVRGMTLLLDEDLLWDTDVTITNGDGTSFKDSDYVTEPRNDNPVWGITLLGSTGYDWEESADGDVENAISVDGKWGFSAAPPNDIKHATIRLVRWLYKQRTGEIESDSPLITPQGIMVMPAKLPSDVLAILNLYRKPRAVF